MKGKISITYLQSYMREKDGHIKMLNELWNMIYCTFVIFN